MSIAEVIVLANLGKKMKSRESRRKISIWFQVGGKRVGFLASIEIKV